jgi:hypothetical protein
VPKLDWVGKQYVVNHVDDVPFRLLQQVPDSSMGESSGNMIVHGDNLEALKALMPYYRGRVKLLFIDPPATPLTTRSLTFTLLHLYAAPQHVGFTVRCPGGETVTSAPV